MTNLASALTRRTPLRAVRLCDWTLRGIGQVMLQNHPLTGLLFWCAIASSALASGQMQVAAGCLVGGVVATGFASVSRVSRPRLAAGLHGYNGALIGTALPCFLAPGCGLWLAIILAAALSVPIGAVGTRLLGRWQLPVLTAPFIVISWGVLALSHHLPGLVALPSAPLAPAARLAFSQWPTMTLNGIGEVFLCSGALSGALMALGLACSSRRAAVLALTAALLSPLLARLAAVDAAPLLAGLYGFNGVLTAITLGDTFRRPGHWANGWLLAALVVTLVAQSAISHLLLPLGLPGLTLPFVLTSWLFLSYTARRG